MGLASPLKQKVQEVSFSTSQVDVKMLMPMVALSFYSDLAASGGNSQGDTKTSSVITSQTEPPGYSSLEPEQDVGGGPYTHFLQKDGGLGKDGSIPWRCPAS